MRKKSINFITELKYSNKIHFLCITADHLQNHRGLKSTPADLGKEVVTGQVANSPPKSLPEKGLCLVRPVVMHSVNITLVTSGHTACVVFGYSQAIIPGK